MQDGRGPCWPRRRLPPSRSIQAMRTFRGRFPLHAGDRRGNLFRLPRRADPASWAKSSASWSCSPRKTKPYRRGRALRCRSRRHGTGGDDRIGRLYRRRRGDGRAAPAFGDAARLVSGRKAPPRDACCCTSRGSWSPTPLPTMPRPNWSRLKEAIDKLRLSVDQMLTDRPMWSTRTSARCMEAYRMLSANSKGWMRRMQADISRGLSAEAAVEKEQTTAARARMEQVPDPYLRERLHDLDDLSNRLLRILTGSGLRYRRRDAGQPGSGGAQYRAGRVAGLWARPQGDHSRRGLRRFPRGDRCPCAGHPARHQLRTHHHRGAQWRP